MPSPKEDRNMNGLLVRPNPPKARRHPPPALPINDGDDDDD